MDKASLAFEPTFDDICKMFDTIVDIMITAVVETPRAEQGLFQVTLMISFYMCPFMPLL